MPADQPGEGSPLDAEETRRDPLLGATMGGVANRRTENEAPTTEVNKPRVGSFTTSLATIVGSRLKARIPGKFLDAGTRGSVLRLAPAEHLRGKEMVEIYLKTARTFLIGRSPVEADWVACFFPRSEKNDLRSMRLSKVHARLEIHDQKLWLYRASGGMLHLGGREMADYAGQVLAEGLLIRLAEDYTLETYFDASLQSTLRFENGPEWRAGKIEFENAPIGAVRFEPLNTGIGFRNSCWLFVDVGFGSARGGVFTAGYELAPQQGVMLRIGGCFWIMNMVDNGKVSVNDTPLAAHEAAPLTHGDRVWLGAIRYEAQIS
jgi:hypothetical protein